MEPIRITAPLSKEAAAGLKAGDTLLISGTLYTGRDAAHKRLFALLGENKPLPVDLSGQLIYYVGPTPAREGFAVGSAGPTTSGRIDRYAPALLDRGLAGMIGKGKRSPEVIDAIRRNGAVYLGAVGGAAALISRAIKHSEVVAYEDLGTEAIHRFTVEDFPAIVLIDAQGRNLYESEPPKYRQK